MRKKAAKANKIYSILRLYMKVSVQSYGAGQTASIRQQASARAAGTALPCLRHGSGSRHSPMKRERNSFVLGLFGDEKIS